MGKEISDKRLREIADRHPSDEIVRVVEELLRYREGKEK
jgi:hypothetical protein